MLIYLHRSLLLKRMENTPNCQTNVVVGNLKVPPFELDNPVVCQSKYCMGLKKEKKSR